LKTNYKAFKKNIRIGRASPAQPVFDGPHTSRAKTGGIDPFCQP